MLVDKILHHYHHYRQGSLSMYHPRHNQVSNGYTHTRVGMIHHGMINVGVVHRTLVRSLKDVGLLIFIDRNRVIGGEGIMPKMSEMFYTKCATGANSYQYTNTPPQTSLPDKSRSGPGGGPNSPNNGVGISSLVSFFT